MAYYSVVKSLYDASPAFGLVFDEKSARYVFADGRQVSGLTDGRIMRLLKMKNGKYPAGPTQWVRLLMTNVGYFGAEAPVEVPTIEDAEAAVLELL